MSLDFTQIWLLNLRTLHLELKRRFIGVLIWRNGWKGQLWLTRVPLLLRVKLIGSLSLHRNFLNRSYSFTNFKQRWKNMRRNYMVWVGRKFGS